MNDSIPVPKNKNGCADQSHRAEPKWHGEFAWEVCIFTGIVDLSLNQLEIQYSEIELTVTFCFSVCSVWETLSSAHLNVGSGLGKQGLRPNVFTG